MKQKPIIWFPEAYRLLTMLWKTHANLPPIRVIPYKVLIGKGITLNARDSTVHEDHVSKINSHKFNLSATQFSTYQKQKCIKPMYKIEVVWLSSSLRTNSFTDVMNRPGP